MINIAVFASGNGSNAREIIRHFQHHPNANVTLVACNKPGAGVIGIAEQAHIPVLMLDKNRFLQGDAYVPELLRKNIHFIVLAGFLLKVPSTLISAFPQRIVNLHPALLPKYGGKGMYGKFVHEAVLAAGEPESGISIHYVDEWYDHGQIIFQATCPITTTDTPESLAQKIHALEHQHFPTVIEKVIKTVKS